MGAFDELLVDLGFDYDPEEIEQFNKDLEGSIKLIKKLTLVAVAGATAITVMTIASTKASDSQGKLAREIGSTVEEIDALEFALRLAGGQAGGMENSLRSLSVRASETRRGVGSGIEAFGILGLSVTDANGKLKETPRLLEEVSARIQGMGKSQQIEIAEKLGLANSIRLLQAGPTAIRNWVAEAKVLGVTTAEDAAIAEEFQQQLIRLGRVLADFSRFVSRQVAPILTKIIDFFLAWEAATKKLRQSKLNLWLDRILIGLRAVAVALAILVPLAILSKLPVLILMFKAATLWVWKFLGALIAGPVFILALLVGLALLAKDAQGYFAGQDSVIGDLIKKFPEWETAIDNVAVSLSAAADLLDRIVTGWKLLIGLKDKFSLDNVKEVLSNIPGFLADITGLGPEYDPNADPFQSPEKTSSQTTTNTINTTTEVPIPTPVIILAAAATLPPARTEIPIGAPAGNTSSVRVDRIDIAVSGAGDPRAVAKAVVNEFQQAAQDLNSPVDQ